MEGGSGDDVRTNYLMTYVHQYLKSKAAPQNAGKYKYKALIRVAR